ncbi:MAG: Ig-like domain-containing protein [Acidobacteria bacterium]|nr:Ig-like domain-containing protein [Acidobacteriota bacterium]
MHSNKFSLTILIVIFAILLTSSLFSKTAYLSTKTANLNPVYPTFQSSGLKLLGPNNDPNPVVNKNNQLKVTVVDANNQPISSNVTYESDSPDIATVDLNGMVKGIQAGYATITAQTPQGVVSNFVVVTQVNGAKAKKSFGQASTSNSGDIYISDPINHVILKSNPSARVDPSVFAGKMGQRGINNGDRTQTALFAGPLGIAIDNRSEGGIFVADSLNSTIRKINFNNQVISAIGSGAQGTMTNDITPFSQAMFRNPQGVAIAANGILYIADTNNHAIYAADFVKQEVRLLAGSPGQSGKADGKVRQALFNRPVSISVNPVKTSFFSAATNDVVILVADAGNNVIRSVSLTGEVATIGRIQRTDANSQDDLSFNLQADNEFTFNNPQSVSLDNLGNIYILDNSGVKVITSSPTQISRQMVSLAQANTFAQASSVVVQGTDVFVLDNGTLSEDDSLKMVSVGAPQINSLSQESDFLEGGSEVIVRGKNFAPESLVVLGDKVVTDVQVLSATELRFRVPSQVAPGNRTLSIQTRGGVSQRAFNFPAKSLAEIRDGDITTIAGGVPFLGDSGKATNAAMHPIGVALDSAGNVFVVDSTNHRIRRIDTTGIITTVAGNGTASFSGDGGVALSASLNTPLAIALDNAGNLFIADSLNSRIRRVDAQTGIITTVAGNGRYAFSGDGSLATSASLNQPGGIALDSKGNLYIADTENHRIRFVDTMTGRISTLAGNGNMGFSGDGDLADKAQLNSPNGLVLDLLDNFLFIADTSNQRIRQIDLASKRISTIAGNGMAGFSFDRGSATSSSLNFPNSIATDIIGNIYIADTLNFRIRKVDLKTGTINTLVGNGTRDFKGDGDLAVNASLQLAMAVAVDGNGNLFIADAETNYRIRKVDAATNFISSIAGIGSRSSGGDGLPAFQANLSNATDLALDKQGDIFIADPDNYRIRRIMRSSGIIDTVAGFGVPGYNGDNIIATMASLDDPTSVAVDGQGNFFIADSGNNRIRKVDIASGLISTIAGNGTDGFSGDGGLATRAMLNQPTAIIFDSQGNLFIADSGNNRVRRIDTRGLITTVAGNGMASFSGDNALAFNASLNFPSSLVLDSMGNLLIADTGNNRVRRVDVRGVITTIVGNGIVGANGDGALAINASLNSPFGLTLDAQGNLFIADSGNNKIRQVDVNTKIIRSVAGSGLRGYIGDARVATSANLNSPKSVAIDSSGNLLIADTGNTAIRVVKGLGKATSPSIMISGVLFEKPNLSIKGSGFGMGAKVLINGSDVSKFINNLTSIEIQLKGNRKKLALKKGANQIIININNISSNTFVLNL